MHEIHAVAATGNTPVAYILEKTYFEPVSWIPTDTPMFRDPEILNIEF